MVIRGVFIVWLIALLIVTALSLAPRELLDENPSIFDSISDKAQHLLAYCGLAVLALGAFRSKAVALPAAVAMLPHGIMLEFLQSAMHMRRNFEIADIVFDGIGVLCGVMAGLLLRRYRRRRAPVAIGSVAGSY
jgi:VanZ family protein